MTSNLLKLNNEKTEGILIGKKSSLSKITWPSLTVGGHKVDLSTSVRDLGLIIDQELSLQKHVDTLVRACNYKMRMFGRIRPFLTYEAAKTVAVALIQSKLDYCNSCLWGIDDGQVHRLQVVQNTAARIVSRTRKRDHISPVLKSLHWLPMSERIEHKVISLTYQCYNNEAPEYLGNLLREHRLFTSMALRSSSQARLYEPSNKEDAGNVKHGQRSFSFTAPRLWNKIPLKLKTSGSLKSFKHGLKSFLFPK